MIAIKTKSHIKYDILITVCNKCYEKCRNECHYYCYSESQDHRLLGNRLLRGKGWPQLHNKQARINKKLCSILIANLNSIGNHLVNDSIFEFYDLGSAF